MTLIVPKDSRDGYRRHAAPESIQANLAAARRRLVEAAEEVELAERAVGPPHRRGRQPRVAGEL